MKKKAYRPKGVNVMAHLTAMGGARRFTPDEQLKRAARVRCSVEELIACKPSREAWADVADTLNLIEALAYVGLVRHARDFIGQQQDHIITAMDRQKSTGSNVLLPVECTLLRDLAATWAEVLAEVTYRQFFEAEERVIRKVQAALRRGSHDGLRVLEVV